MTIAPYHLTTLATALMCIGCANATKGEGSNDSQEVESRVSNTDAIVIENRTVDLGIVGNEEIVSKKVGIRNSSDSDVNITSVETDCSCVTATLPTRRIGAGERVMMTIEFDARGASGSQYHGVTVETDGGQRIEILVVAKVEELSQLTY